MCKTRLSQLPLKKPIVVKPLKAFPLIKDLVTDISWNYEVAKKISPFSPQSDLRFYQEEADRIQEFRKCIECFLCQATCHVIRNHDKKDSYFGPRFLVRLANLVKHPLDNQERLRQIKEEAGIAYCNVTRCCTEVCPEKIKITDNAIIPLKEMIVDKHYDPLLLLWYIIFKNK
jgi:succinate dehydrogenase / fumarate reductase iron-sulfur subunit